MFSECGVYFAKLSGIQWHGSACDREVVPREARRWAGRPADCREVTVRVLHGHWRS